MWKSDNDKIFEKIEKLADKVERKFEKVEARIDSIDKHLAVYNEQLTIHIEGVEETKKQNSLLKDYIDKEIKPLRDHVFAINRIAWFLGGILGVAATVVAILSGLEKVGLF